MSKGKVSTGIAAIMLIAGLFSGWQVLLLVTILLFAFCEVDDNVKNIAVKVITFYIGLTLVITAWGLIVDGIDLVFKSFDKIVATINSYLEYSNQINLDKLESYVITPASNILKIADDIASYLFVFVKFGFIISIFTGKNQKDNMITNKINNYVNKVLTYINNLEMPANFNNAPVNNAAVTATPVQNNVMPNSEFTQQVNSDNMNINN